MAMRMPDAVVLLSRVVSLLCLVTCCATQIIFPHSSLIDEITNPTCYGSRMSKVHFSQADYVQYIEYVATIPGMTALTTCFWLNLEEPERVATALNYALDYLTSNNNITLQWRGNGDPSWSLKINDVPVYKAVSAPLPANEWIHVCHSWDSSNGEWSVFQSGQRLQSGISIQSIGLEIPAGGTMTAGQHQETLEMGMDMGEGINGWITLQHVSSTAIPDPTSTRSQQAMLQFASDCRAVDRGDVIGWLRTSRRGYGGLTEATALEACQRF